MYSEILETNVRKILGRIILRKYRVKFSLTFGSNLRRKVFENLRKFVFRNSEESLRKFLKNFETEYSQVNFSTFGNSFEVVRSRKF